jgi:hemoglobin/transferrin/lactoferrin receptor protein
LGLTVGWQPTADVLATLVVENIFNVDYTPYFENNPSPGTTVKGGLKVRFGG